MTDLISRAQVLELTATLMEKYCTKVPLNKEDTRTCAKKNRCNPCVIIHKIRGSVATIGVFSFLAYFNCFVARRDIGIPLSFSEFNSHSSIQFSTHNLRTLALLPVR